MDVTQQIKPPRAVFVPFMMGHHFGVPFHKKLQRQIILEALDLVVTASESGVIKKLSVTWAEARRQGKDIEEGLIKMIELRPANSYENFLKNIASNISRLEEKNDRKNQQN